MEILGTLWKQKALKMHFLSGFFRKVTVKILADCYNKPPNLMLLLSMKRCYAADILLQKAEQLRWSWLLVL